MHFASLEFDYEHGAGVTYTITATGGLNNDPTYNAEYVDVEYDGVQRTTGSSMDLGSFSFGAGSMRGGPGSLSGSMGRSPRSPLGLLPRSPLGGSLATPGVAEEPPELTLKVGSAPAATAGVTAAAAVVRQYGSNGSSRLRPDGVASGAAGFKAGDGVVGNGVGVESRRLEAGKQLSSFSVRVSNEFGSDAGDGVSDGPGVTSEGPGSAAAGPGTVSETQPLLGSSANGASRGPGAASASGTGSGSGGGTGSGGGGSGAASGSRRGRGRRGNKGKGK